MKDGVAAGWFWRFLVGILLMASCTPALAQDSPLERAKELQKETELLYQQGKYAEAIIPAKKLLALCEEALGPEHPVVAGILDNLVALYKASGDYAAAAVLYERILETKESQLGPAHPDVATILNNMGMLHRTTGDPARARPLLERALKIREDSYGLNHPAVAVSLNNLAGLLVSSGDHAAARPLYKRALKISEESLGPDHPILAKGLNNLASSLQTTGDYVAARPLYERALKIFERSLGADHPDVAVALNNLAKLHHVAGDYMAARPYLERALEISESTLGEDHPNVAESLNILGALHRAIGDYDTARLFYERALKIWETALGQDHTKVAICINNLATLLAVTGDHTTAKTLYKRSLTIFEKALGPDHASVAAVLVGLAFAFEVTGDYEAAKPLLERALKIWEKSLGPVHRNVGLGLGHLALLSVFTGDYAAANSLFERALKIYEKALGPDNPEQAVILLGLALLFEATGDDTSVKPLLERAELLIDGHLRRTSGALSPRQQLAMVLENRYILDRFLVSIEIGSITLSDIAAIWRWKGRVAEVLGSVRAAVSSGSDRALNNVFQDLISKRRELARLAFTTPRPGEAGKLHRRLKDIEGQIEELEVEIARNSAAMAAQKALRHVSVKKVQAALPEGTLLLDYLRYSHSTLNPKTHGIDHQDRYLAVYMDREHYGIAHLGEAEAIDQAVTAFRNTISQPDAPKERIRATGTNLRKMILDPVLVSNAASSDSLIVAPDAALHSVAFAALPGYKSGSYLVEEYGISYASSGKDLIRWQQPRKTNHALLVVGDPDFTLTSVRRSPGARRGEDVSTCVTANWRQEVSRLPGTRVEATKVSRLFPGKDRERHLLLDSKATEAVVKQLMQSARYVHLATHGFFFSGECSKSTKEETRGLAVKQRLNLGKEKGREPLAQVDNPLLLSGLLLSGAAVAAPTGGDDGVLTAFEVMNLDLTGTELVTLSACDTGLGEVASGEGVMGLRSAFLTSGARSLVLSLWKVPDTQTQLLMEDFYTMVFVDGLSLAESLRKGMLNAIASSDSSRSHPSAWASFTYTGPSR